MAEPDWTEDLPDTEHVRFFKSIDWPATRLGPLPQWSTSLKLFTRMVLADSRAACVWWYAATRRYSLAPN